MVSGRKLSRSRAPCRADRLRLLLALTSLAGTFFLAALYTVRPVRGVALTTWPLVLTLAPVILVGLLSLNRRAPRRSLWLVLAWLTVLLGLSEEPRSLLRSVWGPARREQAWEEARAQGRGLRVVSLNCAGGLLEVAEEAFAVEPDVILLQESPGLADLRAGRQHGNWQAVATADCTVLARGLVTPLPQHREDTVTLCLAQVRPEALRPREVLTVQSVHFSLPSIRSDLWRPAAWRQGQAAWAGRVRQARHVASYVPRDPHAAVLIGGDFNTPGGDSLFRELRAVGLRDAFRLAGLGWPNTWMDEAPLTRIDQIWLSPRLHPLVLRVVPSRQSDHRLVVCDLVLN